MTLPLSTTRRVAAPALALLAMLLAHTATRAQDAPDADAVLAKVKDGAGLAKVKEKLAADPLGVRVRVDAFSLNDDKALKPAGVVLLHGATDEDRAEFEKQARDKVIAAVREAADAKEFKDFDFTAVKPVGGEKLPHIQLQKAANDAGKANPAADEVRFDDAKFDAKGQLVVVGVAGPNPKTAEWVAGAAKAALAMNPAAVGADEKPIAVVLDVKPAKDWPLSPAAVQKALAGANSPGLARIRVERIFLTAAPAKVEETNPTGTAWSYAVSGVVLGTQPIPKADLDKLTKDVVPAVLAAAKWPAVTTGDLEAISNADNRVPDPGPSFQKAIAEKPTLDGVRIDSRTEFGPDGKLVLRGLQPGLDAKQLGELNATIRGVLTALAGATDAPPGYRKLTDLGVSIDRLERVKVRELHAELRKWATESIDDVRLNRLYFDDKSRLVLTCEAPDEGVKALVETQLAERAAKVIPGVPVTEPAVATDPKEPEKKEEPKEPEKKEPKEPEKKEEPKEEKKEPVKDGALVGSPISARLPQEPKTPPVTPGTQPVTPPVTPGTGTPGTPAGPPPVVGVEFTKFKGGLTKFLQQQAADPKNKQWESLLIERGFFNENNEYTVRGVADSEGQRKAFSAYLDSLKADPQWGPYFSPKPHAAPDFAVVPMAKLVERAQKIMPAFRIFDGIRVVGARYAYVDDRTDPGQMLVFDAQIVGRPAAGAVDELRRMIAADTKYYGRRLPRSKGGALRPIEIRSVAPAAGGGGESGTVTVPDMGTGANTVTVDQVGTFAEGFGALALSKGEMEKAAKWVDAGTLHAPHLSSLWFLSAYYHHLNGEGELARRDLFRVIELEDPLAFDGPNQRKRRYRVAADLQGRKRDELEKVWLELWKDYKDGIRPGFAEMK